MEATWILLLAPCAAENVQTKGNGGWSQAATGKEHQETPEAETRTHSPKDFFVSDSWPPKLGDDLFLLF